MNYPLTRFVFNRKKTKEENKLIQVEVLYLKKKKYISTGVKVPIRNWSDKKHIVATQDAPELNRRIDDVKYKIDSYISSLQSKHQEFSWDELSSYVDGQFKFSSDFADWIRKRIDSRGDIRDSTKKTHRKLPVSLREFGKIKTFSDVTKANVRDYYEWMQHRTLSCGRRIKQPTVWSYMKFLRTYVREAMARDLISTDPFIGLKVPKGDSESGRWVNEAEVERLEEANLTGHLSKVRDLFLIQCYTGFAYSDLMDFSIEKLHKDENDEYIVGRRMKTKEEYVVLLLPKAKRILEKYKYKLPIISNQKYNDYLKDLAKKCEIKKPIASHWARRTCGMLMLNHGVRLEVVSRVLGHSSVKTTEACYASILHKTVVAEMKKMVQ